MVTPKTPQPSAQQQKLARGFGFAAKARREEMELWGPDPKVQAAELTTERQRFGAAWRISEMGLPIMADMCADVSQGRVLPEIHDDALAALDSKADDLDGSLHPLGFIPRPFLHSPMYAGLRQFIVHSVIEAEQYQA